MKGEGKKERENLTSERGNGRTEKNRESET